MVANQKTLNKRTGVQELLISLSPVCFLVVLAWLVQPVAKVSANHQIAKSPDHQIQRIISLVPAATEMLYAIGAGPRWSASAATIRFRLK